MPAKILSAALSGLDAIKIYVEADSGGGDFGYINIIGLADKTVKESSERVRSALRNSSLDYPKRKITINLYPSDLQKHGTVFDLAIAISILSLKNKFHLHPETDLFLGELSLTGELKTIRGVFIIILMALKKGLKRIFLPYENYQEAVIIKTNLEIIPINTLNELIDFLQGKKTIKDFIIPKLLNKPSVNPKKYPDLKDVKGCENAKKALKIALAGGHNILFFGPPGTGKTLLTKAATGLMPCPDEKEKIEITKIKSLKNNLSIKSLINERPFRFPRHNSSLISFIGGGNSFKLGEISLAHRGVLVLDDVSEFPKKILESIRQPLEEKFIEIRRANYFFKIPSDFILIATINPCPCGYYKDKEKICLCSEKQIKNFSAIISGPIMDRIDLRIEMKRFNWNEFSLSENYKIEENSETAKKQIDRAREIQNERFKESNIKTNADIPFNLINKFCHLNKAGEDFLNLAAEKLKISQRSYFKIIKIARTIADLKEKPEIEIPDLAEALQYRQRN